MSDKFGYGDKKNNNLIICGMWETKNGHFNSTELDEKAASSLVAALKSGVMGSKIILRFRTEAAIAKSNDPTRTPVAYLEFVPAADVQAFKASRQKPQNVI